MSNQDANQDRDPYGFFKMQPEELRKVIVNVTRETLDLEDEKKEYTASVNEIIKENKGRIRQAIEALKQAEKTGQDAAQEVRVADFLKAVPTPQVANS